MPDRAFGAPTAAASGSVWRNDVALPAPAGWADRQKNEASELGSCGGLGDRVTTGLRGVGTGGPVVMQVERALRAMVPAEAKNLCLGFGWRRGVASQAVPGPNMATPGYRV